MDPDQNSALPPQADQPQKSEPASAEVSETVQYPAGDRELYIRELERRLAEAHANLRVLASAQIDAVLQNGKTSPLLLREAQAALQRSKVELEEKVVERTAELVDANARLQEVIQELARREVQLRESERRFRTMADGAPVLIWVTDEQGTLEFINRAYAEFFGSSIEKLPLEAWRSVLHPDDAAQFLDFFTECLRERRSFRAQVRVRRIDGEWRWIDSQGQPRFSESGEYLGMAGSSLDISDQKQAEEALGVSDARLRVALGHAGIFIYSQDRELRYTWIYNPLPYFADVHGKTDAELLPEESANRLTEIKRRVLETGKGIHQEVPLSIGGESVYFDLVVEPVMDSQGNVISLLCSSLDITERKKAEEALLESQKYIRRLIDTSYEGIWSVDRYGSTTFVNQRAAEILGYTLEEVTGKNAFEFLMPEQTDAGKETLARIIAGESGRVEAKARRKDGSEAILLASYSPILNDQGQFDGAFAMFTDITERIQAERDLQHASEQLKEYSEHLEARVRARTEELVNLQRSLVEKVEAERLWVSQELHDSPMQEIYGLMYRISGLKNATDNTAMQDEINFMLEKLKEINEGLRSVTREMRPTTLTPFGLEKAIREHSERFDTEYPELHLTLDLMPDGKMLPEHMRLSLFRIYQTALSNVIRHAHANHIYVKFAFDDESAFLEIQDDGVGFTAPSRLRTFARQGHFGLPGSAERAEAMGGVLEVESAPGKGTLLRVTVPLNNSFQPP